jgi:probable F420-dependent oxidoreductase
MNLSVAACQKPGAPLTVDLVLDANDYWTNVGRAEARSGRSRVPAMVMDIGRYGIWTNVLDAHPSSTGREAAQLVEQLGFSALWLPEATGRDPFVTASLMLAATSRLVVATGIANVYARDAMTMKACQLSLHEAFPDRFLLGLGVSSPVLVEKVRGHQYGKPFSYMAEYLRSMDSAVYNAAGPKQDPGRVLAALGPRMLKLSSEAAAGAHPYLTDASHTREARRIIGPDALLAPEQMVVLETDPSAARAIARPAVGFYLRAPGYLANLRRMGFDDSDWADPKAASDRLVDAIVAWGDRDAIAARINAHHEAGANHVCIQVLRADREIPAAEWRELAAALL